MLPQQSDQDIAACAALNFLFGGQPSSKSKELMTRFGYWDGEKLTEAGAVAAADASGGEG